MSETRYIAPIPAKRHKICLMDSLKIKASYIYQILEITPSKDNVFTLTTDFLQTNHSRPASFIHQLRGTDTTAWEAILSKCFCLHYQLGSTWKGEKLFLRSELLSFGSLDIKKELHIRSVMLSKLSSCAT